MPDEIKRASLEEDSLIMHASGRPGKLEIAPTKPLITQRDLSLAYSPGVAAPCLKIAEDPDTVFDYTAKGNVVAIISNGTAVLGLGNIGAAASKPVMEGKAVLFKRFADIDGIDLEVGTEDVDAFIAAVRYLGPSFGGINLEDIRAPDCFIIEQQLREMMDIPVFHDDQHGTAIVSAAGLINAVQLTGRSMDQIRIVSNGAGAASIACVELMKAMGVRHENVILCDREGVIYQGRETGMNQWKSAHAVPTDARTLAEALVGADVFLGLSVANCVTGDMVRSMADKPIIFAMANPTPEISPEEALAACPDAIVATGRSDYPNQINNVLGFPYIFRGALDVRATTINEPMKIAAAEAIAAMAREDVPDEVANAYGGRRLQYGPEYIIPVPFDPRLIAQIPPAVAKAAIDSGVARRPMQNMAGYRKTLESRLDPTAAALELIFETVRQNPQRVVFSEGEEERSVRAAVAFYNAGFGTPLMVGREEVIEETIKRLGLRGAECLEIHNARLTDERERYTAYLYERQKRRGMLLRDCQRQVNQNRNVFAACMVACGDADAMVTGLTRSFGVAYDDIRLVFDAKPNKIVFGLAMVRARGRTVFIADTNVNENPTPQALARIAIQAASHVRRMGHEPRVALSASSNFGNPWRESSQLVREAIGILDEQGVDFEYDGEMAPDMALNPELRNRFYPFCRINGAANVLIMPNLHTANIAFKLVQQMGGATVIGPLLLGLTHPIEITPMRSTVTDIVNAAALAAHEAWTRHADR
ncbi:MAG: NADP-dependent malic enzyme [Alphaproteobacteria bacterium]